jgi:hypothetical protein
MKNLTPLGIESATFRLVAQCLNQLRYCMHRVEVHMCNSPVSLAFFFLFLAENTQSYSEVCCVSLPLRAVATAVRVIICRNSERVFEAEFESLVPFFF